jgi:hypothetical protein
MRCVVCSHGKPLAQVRASVILTSISTVPIDEHLDPPGHDCADAVLIGDVNFQATVEDGPELSAANKR